MGVQVACIRPRTKAWIPAFVDMTEGNVPENQHRD